MGERSAVVVAHPSPDLYGSDRMLAESVRALSVDRRVLVVLPADGPLSPRLREAGAEIVILPFPVLRKAFFSPLGLFKLGLAALRAMPSMAALVRRERPQVLYVNTLTIPLWLVVARLTRVPALCHVHEAEENLSRPVKLALELPLKLARMAVANSTTCGRVIGRTAGDRVRVVVNGVPGPPAGPLAAPAAVTPPRPAPDSPVRLVVIGRLSPRKGCDVAIRAVGRLTERGHKVTLTLVGDVFPGYEWFEDELRALAAEVGGVEFAGFRPAPWESLAEADVAVVPSLGESFGNVAVEAMLAGRPLVASAAGGLDEIVKHEKTGLLVRPGDADALADGVQAIIEDWQGALARAERARADAQRRFSEDRYHHELRAAVQAVSVSSRRIQDVR